VRKLTPQVPGLAQAWSIYPTVAAAAPGTVERAALPSGAASAVEALSGENKPDIKKFIAFCRQGAFEIH
jgi:hypothetical protein